MKIFVAIPGRGHSLDFNVTACLMEEYALALQCGVHLEFRLFPSSGGIADGRNFLVADFLKSDCDRIFFLDSDITFRKGDLLQCATKPVDFVGGAYRHKKEEESYPIQFKEGEMCWDENKLIQVDKLPFGFICLTRNVFKKFDEKFPERYNKNFGLKSTCYFQFPIGPDGVLWGEDFCFCKEWNEMGGKVYLDPELELTHWGALPTPYKGHIGNWLKSQPKNIARRLILMKEKETGKKFEPIEVKDIDVEALKGNENGKGSESVRDLSAECLPQGL